MYKQIRLFIQILDTNNVSGDVCEINTPSNKRFCIRAFAEKTMLGTNVNSIMHNII